MSEHSAEKDTTGHQIEDVYGDAICRRCGRVFRGHWLEHPQDVPCDPIRVTPPEKEES